MSGGRGVAWSDIDRTVSIPCLILKGKCKVPATIRTKEDSWLQAGDVALLHSGTENLGSDIAAASGVSTTRTDLIVDIKPLKYEEWEG
jgi:hypothetical protein